MTRPMKTTTLAALVALMTVGVAHAQTPDLQTSGTSYFIFAEPGAPTVEVTVVGEGVKSGIYRLQEGTTLTQLIALSGGVPTSEETERQIIRALIRVLREQSGTRSVIYEATTEQAIRQPGTHPPFLNGDLVEMDVEYEELGRGVTVLDVLQIASRVASLISAAILLYTRVN